MSWYDSKQNSLCQWKKTIDEFQSEKVKVNFNQQILKQKDFKNMVSLNVENLILNGSFLLTQVKTYNTEVVEFLKRNILTIIYSCIKYILQIPNQSASQIRKYKLPLLGLQFLQGLVTLPNIMLINVMNQQVYQLYCKCIFYFFEQSSLFLKSHSQQYQNNLYFNYFQRLFNIPKFYNGLEQSKYGTYSNITASVVNSIVQKKISFFQTLIDVIQQNYKYCEILIQNIENQSILSCLRMFVIMNGMHNCPLKVKLYVIKKGLQNLFQYNQFIKSILKKEKIFANNFKLQEKVQNIFRLFIEIGQTTFNIYDGKKMLDTICTKDFLKLCIQLISANFIYLQKNSQREEKGFSQIISSSIEQKITSLLQIMLRQDLQYCKSAKQSPNSSIFNSQQINEIFLMVHSLKIVNEKNRKLKIKDINLIKILNLMFSNPLRYDIIDKVKKYSFFKILFELAFKNSQNDIFLNQLNKIFLSIFKSQISICQSLAFSKIQNSKKQRQQVEEKIISLSFQGVQAILQKIHSIKSHKDPLFGHFFKLSRCIKQYCRNYLKYTDPELLSNTSFSQSSQSSVCISFNLQDLQLIHKNDYIRSKCKQWYQFYQKTFAQLQMNCTKQLGKFQQFNQLPPQVQTKFTVKRYCEVNSVTQSQFIHNKQQIQASMKNSMEILNISNLGKQMSQTLNQNSKQQLNFKKKNFENYKEQIPQNKLISKDQISSLQQPIKIQFNNINLDTFSSQSQNDQQALINTEKIEESQLTFQKFMKKRISQISQQNQICNIRKKSKTPTKFKSSQSKTPPKQKKWGTNTGKIQNVEVKEKQTKIIPTNDHLIQRRAKSQQKIKLQALKQRLKKHTNQFSNLKIIKVGDKRPKIYKQRQLNQRRDSKIMLLLRG